MATICPHATYDPLGPQTAARMSRHDIVCLHTMAGPFSVVDDMFHNGGYSGTESHFGVRGDGFAKQWQDLEFRADANYEGNHRIISIETADMREGFPVWSTPDVPAWTPAQLDKIVALVRWCCDTYDIPKVLVPDSSSVRRGIAYHRQGIDGNFGPPHLGRRGIGERWSTGTGKPCPGDRRIRQLIEIVIPRVRGEEDEMNEAQEAKLDRVGANVIQIEEAVGALTTKVGEIDKHVTTVDKALARFRDDEDAATVKAGVEAVVRRVVREELAAAAPEPPVTP